MSYLNTAQNLAAARLLACKATPFLARAVMALIPTEDRSVPTIGVSADMTLSYNPDCIDKWTTHQLGTVLIHEACHIIREHGRRCKDLGVSKEEFPIWNEACDMEINDDLAEMRLPFPTTPPPCLPKDRKLRDGMTAEWYYAEIRKAGGQPKADSGVCAGDCGTGVTEAPGEAGEGRSSVEIQCLRMQVAEDINQLSQQGRGNVPGSWCDWAALTVRPAKVRWQDKLQRAFRGATAMKAGLVDYTYSRPSRRQAGVGYGYGCPILPAMVAPIPRVAVGVDTSGSMGIEGMETAAAEIDGILKTLRADVQYIAGDCVVTADTKIKSVSQMQRLVSGGGGTDFRPIFEAVEKLRPKPSIFVFITDGDGPSPVNPPAGVEVIWVLCGRYRQDPGVSWGTKIDVDS